MKRRQIAMILGLVLCAASLGSGSVYAAETHTEQNVNIQETNQEEENTVYGEVVSVSENSIKIKVGVRKEMRSDGQDAQPEQMEIDGQQQDPGAGQKEQPSMLELTGEELEIAITADTMITKQKSEQPGGGMGGMQGEAPQIPSGAEGEAPEKPQGGGSEAPAEVNGEVPEMPSGGDGSFGTEPSETITWENIKEGDTVLITMDDTENAAMITLLSMEMGDMGQPGGGMGQPGGGMTQQVDSYDAVTEYTEDVSTEGETYTSTGKDENAVHVYNDAVATIQNAEIIRTSEESTGGDSSSFYGVGAALLTSAGSTYISESTIQTDAAGGAGLFAYGTGTIYASDTTIATQKDTSGGIHAAGGGTLYAWNLTAETQGESSAAIRSDRGGGVMVIDGGNYTSNGSGSPAIYSTADIAVNNAILTANGSEAICIEGLNSIHLYNSELTGNMSDDERNDCTWNVILYQSMSGDSEVGNSTFEMQGGTLTAKNGGMFYTTNTESTITLVDVDIIYAQDSDFFLKCTGNENQRGWGQSGKNGADCLFTAIKQEMQGDIIWDSISNLDLYLTEGSSFIGAFVNDETNAKEAGEGYCNVYISEDSTWTVTKDSMISSLQCAGTIMDEAGNIVTIQGKDGTIYVDGTSEYTITVEDYQDSADLSGASQRTEWSAYEIEKPSELA